MTSPAKSPFSTNIPNWQVAWDSTSLGWIKTCARLYQYQMLDQWSPKSKGIHLAFGGWYASGVEHYAHYRAEGSDHDTATLRMVRWVLENSGSRTWTSQCQHTEDQGPCETCEWTAWSPGDHKDANIKNRYTLIRSLVWNVEEHLTSPFSTVILADGRPAVELTFNFDAFEIEGETVSLSGHLDRLAEATGELWVIDDKAQPAWCKVLTPNGWVEIGALKVGDRIAGRDGDFYNVTALYPKGMVPTYRVEFHDNTHTHCAFDHLWNIASDGQDAWKTKPLNEFMNSVARGRRWHVPNCMTIEHPERELEVDPYLLGALLGDGHFGGNSVQITSSKSKVLVGVEEAVARMGDIFRKNPADNLCWTITNNRNCATLKGLQKLGLWGKLSAHKFIPEHYLFASIEQRRALLQGLLDTDGSRTGDYRRYQTMSKQLANDVASLLRSLGGSASVTLQPRNMYRVSFRTGEDSLPVRRRYIKSVTLVEPCENICIAIDALDNLYLTDNYIVTHNTTKGALNAQYFKGYTPHNQMSLYAIAGKVIADRPVRGVLVRAAQIGVGFTRFATGQAPRPSAVLTEWLHNTEVLIRQAREYAIADYWPMNDKSCSDYGGCPFQAVCSVSPSHRQAWLEEGFDKRTWNPLEARGDI